MIKVTSLADNSNPGTLRYALSVLRGPRIVIFDVGGVITTTSRMTVSDQYVTVAGQTAPGKGIVVRGWPIGLSGATDVIFRHFKVRPGRLSGQTVDGMGMAGSNHCIFDRCSMVRQVSLLRDLAKTYRGGGLTRASRLAEPTISPSSAA